MKCQDEIESGRQKRTHIELWEITTREFGFLDEDLFTLLSTTRPAIRQTRQYHARKNSSYLWIFRKSRRVPIESRPVEDRR